MFSQEAIAMVFGIVAALVIIAVVVFLAKKTKEVGNNTGNAANGAIGRVFGEVGNNGSGSKTESGTGSASTGGK